MIGKNNYFNYYFLIVIITFIIFINSLYFKNLYFLGLFFLSLFLSSLSTKYGIKILTKNNLLQKIRKEGPSNHITKEKTPTMGGVFIIPIFLIVIISLNFSTFLLKISCLMTIAGFFIIGLIDDFKSISNQTNLGLKAKEKFILQTIVASVFIALISSNNLISPNINFFNEFTINANVFILPISLITIIALSNSVNLTDGLDGLASGCSSIVFCGLGTEILLNNNSNHIIYSLLSFCMSGLCLGFLRYNKYPAKIFMGDTGSLSIGAVIGVICVLTNSFFTTFILSGVFIIETLSVILQVTYFKFTKRFFKKGKKIFLMTPIHHHFELKGLKEEEIVGIFWKINIILIFFSIVLKISF